MTAESLLREMVEVISSSYRVSSKSSMEIGGCGLAAASFKVSIDWGLDAMARSRRTQGFRGAGV